MDVLRHWIEIARETVDPFQAKRLAFMGAFLLLGFFYMWGLLFSLITQVDGALINPLFIFKAMLNGVPGPYGVTALAILAFFVVLGCLAVYQHYQMGIHGRARWATEVDIKRAYLYSEKGLLLGRRWMQYLCANVIDGDGHLWVYAPSGSGKGTGFLIPNLLNWKHSAIVLDLKRELYDLTSGFRAKYGQKVYLFDPSSKTGETVRFNPLDFVDRNHLTRISDIKNLTEILWPTSGDRGEIWQPNARSLFVALALYMMDTKRPLTFGNVLREIKLAPNFAEHLEKLIDLHFDPNTELELDPLTVQNFMAFLQQASKEQSGVLSTIKSGLELWEDPIVDAATSATDFDLRQLRKQKITIYVGVSLGKLKRLKPLLNMFFQQCLIVLTEKEPQKDEPYRVLMALDEFPLLGRLDAIKEGISFLRSFGVRMMIVCQSKVQVASTYDVNTARIYAQSCKYVVAYAPNDHQEAQEISDILGRKTVKSVSRTYSQGNMSTNVSYTGRELMTADEVRRFTKHKSLIIVENMPPIKARKVNYLKDKALKDRVLGMHPVPYLDIETFKAKVDAEYQRAALEIAAERKDKKEEGFHGNTGKKGAKPQKPSSEAVSLDDFQKENAEMAASMGYVDEIEDIERLDESQKESLVDLFDDEFLGE